MIVYESSYDYIECAPDLRTKIIRMDQIINAFSDALLAGALDSNTAEYSLDDGQSKVKETTRSPAELVKSIEAMEKLRNMYVVRYNKLNTGSIFRLMDSKNLRSGYGC